MAASFDPDKPPQITTAFRQRDIVWISLAYCATGIAEATSNYIMPDSIHAFTQNAFVISVILSMNPLFGFVAQPWAGWYSDRIWTPLGRRKPLILVGSICLALSSLGLPLAQQQAGHLGWLAPVLRVFGRPDVTAGLVIFACWNLVYQFMVDVISIMIRCLIGDVVPVHQRGKAFAATNIVFTCMTFLTLWYGGAIARQSELKWYALVSVVVLLAMLPVTFLLREPPVAPIEKTSGRPGGYLRAVRETPHFSRMCLVIASTFVAGQLILNYYRLFTREQLHLTLDEALKPFSWMPAIAFFASYPIGWISDRVSQKHVTQAGAVLLGIAGWWGVFAQTIWDLRIMAIVVGLGLVCVEVASNAYLISLMPAGKIGQLSGFANIFRGGPRFLMFFGAGALIEIFDRNYRIAFGGAVVFSAIAFGLLCLLPKEGSIFPECAGDKTDSVAPPR